MLTLRLSRIGKRKQPYFRLIAVEKGKDPWGTNVEILGTYDPRSKAQTFNTERVSYWLGKGAQPSDRVHNMLVDLKLLESKKRTASRISHKRQGKLAAAAPKAETSA
ncbi:30S ribosomal protein S16 [Candidatus Uhrbacteria bacterium]|nr:30S ribosomal protein S16 [Candidatus Uhrbacteria bacterium]